MEWLEEAYNHLDPQKCQKILIGNKTDLVEERAIDYDAAENTAISLGMTYYETSAKEDVDDILQAFNNLSKKIMDYRLKNLSNKKKISPEEKKIDYNQKLHDEDSKSFFSKCACI